MYVKFRERLSHLGYNNYKQYLESDYWQSVRDEYAASRLPTRCLGCGWFAYQLHHRSYERLGRELLMDFIPLCGKCHQSLHAFIKDHDNYPLAATARILQIRLNWSKKETQRILLPFSFNSGHRWLPRGQKDLKQMRAKLGRTAVVEQHKRIFGNDRVPDFQKMLSAEAEQYCRQLVHFDPVLADQYV